MCLCILYVWLVVAPAQPVFVPVPVPPVVQPAPPVPMGLPLPRQENILKRA